MLSVVPRFPELRDMTPGLMINQDVLKRIVVETGSAIWYPLRAAPAPSILVLHCAFRSRIANKQINVQVCSFIVQNVLTYLACSSLKVNFLRPHLPL